MLAIHGGPHSMYNGGFNFAFQEHAANGYVVLYTNPRGSTGYGTEFANAINHDYPGADFPDLMKGVDEMLARGYVDADNLFVYGCSGGGILTSYIVGNTDRFRAASANCPIVNWMSAMGTSDAITYLRTFEKPFWEDPAEWIDRSSIFYVGNVTTPTMFLTGERDLRTPMAQTEEFYQALQYIGVPTVMIRFPDEWHGTSSRPSNFLRTQLYLRKWFEKWGTHAGPMTSDVGSGSAASGGGASMVDRATTWGCPASSGWGCWSWMTGSRWSIPGRRRRLEALGAGLAETGHSLAERARDSAHPHPPGSRHGRGRDRAGGAGRPGVRARGGRAPHGRPVAPAGVGRADLRRPDGRAVGRVSARAARVAARCRRGGHGRAGGARWWPQRWPPPGGGVRPRARQAPCGLFRGRYGDRVGGRRRRDPHRGADPRCR